MGSRSSGNDARVCQRSVRTPLLGLALSKRAARDAVNLNYSNTTCLPKPNDPYMPSLRTVQVGLKTVRFLQSFVCIGSVRGWLAAVMSPSDVIAVETVCVYRLYKG